MYKSQHTSKFVYVPREYLKPPSVKHVNCHRDRTQENQDDQTGTHRSRRHDQHLDWHMHPCQYRPRHTCSSHAFVVPGTLRARYNGQVSWQMFTNGLKYATAAATAATEVHLLRGEVLEINTESLANRGNKGIRVEECTLVLVDQV